MKIRMGFVSNSSSTAFIITNKTKKTLKLEEFVKENPQLIVQFLEQYDWYKEDPKFTQECLVGSAKQRRMRLKPGENHVVFGDEDGTIIGHVFDYILRDGGKSKRFSWKFEEHYR